MLILRHDVNITKTIVAFQIVIFFTIISKPLSSESSIHEKNVTLSWKKNVLKNLKNYIRNHLYSSKVNVTDPRKNQLV